MLAPLIAQALAMMVSRQREYLADASGAELTRNPIGLAHALEKIESAVAPTRAINRGIGPPVHRRSAGPSGQSQRRVLVRSVRVAPADVGAHRGAQGNGVRGRKETVMAIDRQGTGLT